MFWAFSQEDKVICMYDFDSVSLINTQTNNSLYNFFRFKVSKNVAAACVGAKNLHTGRPWLQKTGKKQPTKQNDLKLDLNLKMRQKWVNLKLNL